MGIDIYARWPGQTEAERDAQFTGMSVVHGHVGYLREAYHGGPYATRSLVPEAFDDASGDGAAIPSATLRERLPAVVLMHLYREHKLYGGGKDPSHVELDELADVLCMIRVREFRDDSHRDFAENLTSESIATAKRLIAGRVLPESALAFVDFVDLIERKERETGEPCRVLASY